MSLALSIVLLACSATADTITLERVVDAAVEAPLRERRFSGIVLVTKDGRPLLRKAYGMADRENGVPNMPDTPFMIMSVSKQFTAALVLRLAAQQRLSLDDRVSDYLADWPSEWDEVRIHHLLSHSAGTHIDTTFFWLIHHHPEYWPEPIQNRPPYEPRALESAPGTQFLYSNIGYTLLTRIASAAGGKPFDELMRDEVFCPLGMEHTQPERSGSVRGRARGYRRTETGFARSEQRTIDIVGAGDLVSTVDDLAKWDAALDDDRFLPASLRSAMLTPHVTGKMGGVGYGWFFRNALQFHSGSGAGFRAWNYRIPDLDVAVIVLSNVEESDSSWVRGLLDAITESLTRNPLLRPPH